MKFLILILFISSFYSYAYSPSCSNNGTTIVYSNGLDSSPAKTISSYTALTKRGTLLTPNIDKNYSKSDGHVSYDWIHNDRYSDDANIEINRYRDYITTTIFLIKTNYRAKLPVGFTDEHLIRLTTNFDYDPKFNQDPKSSYLLEILNFVAEEYATLKAEEAIALTNNLQENNVIRLVAKYRSLLNANKRVLAITHGEGSVLNNEAYELTFDPNYSPENMESHPERSKENYFSSAHIAPMNNLFSIGTHIKFDKDTYFNKLTSILFIPEANVIKPFPTHNNDPFFHDFIATYLKYEPVSGPSEIDPYLTTLGGIIRAAELLKSNCGLPPVPNFLPTVKTGDSMTYQFDASSSYDEDDSIVKYEWFKFGVSIGEGKIIEHTFISEGQYPITLVLTDQAGNQRGHIISIDAFNPPPTAAFTSSISSLTASFDASTSSDNNGSITKYEWDFGDFTTETSDTPHIAHEYPGTGEYTVTLTVTDNHGKTSIEMKTIFISPGVQVFARFDRRVGVNGMIFDASNSFQLPFGPLQYKWTFSDDIEGDGEVFTRNFDTEGTYTVTLKVTGSGGVFETRSQTFNVSFNITTGPFTYTGTMIAMVNISQMPDGTYMMALYVGGVQYIASWSVDGQLVTPNVQGFNSATVIYNFTKPSTPVSICLTDPVMNRNCCTIFDVLRSYQ